VPETDAVKIEGTLSLLPAPLGPFAFLRPCCALIAFAVGCASNSPELRFETRFRSLEVYNLGDSLVAQISVVGSMGTNVPNH
jgi:hypothetical protein